jgi:CshA-type fibril repeat protein
MLVRRQGSAFVRALLVIALVAASALSVAIATVATSSRAEAAPAPTGTLNVREYVVKGCAYNAVVANYCGGTPSWLPSEGANADAIRRGTGNAGAACTPQQVNLGATSVSATGVDCNDGDGTGTTRSTANLLKSIYPGVDSYGLPDLPPAGSYVPSKAGATASRNSCTTTTFGYTDISPSTCGQTTNSTTESSWSIVEGWIKFPATASGNVVLRENNTDSGGTARAQYNSFWVATDANPANLAFRGEAQTAFQVPSNIDLTIDVPTATSNACLEPYRYVRLYHMDNSDGSSARLTWSLDGGNTFTAIPSSALSNQLPATDCGALSKSLTAGPTRNADGTFTLTYRVSLFNQGYPDLVGAQVTDNLLAAPSTFPSSTQVVSATADPVTGTACATWPVNTGFNGTTSTTVFAGTHTLAGRTLNADGTTSPVTRCSVDLTFRLKLPVSTTTQTYNNSAQASWTGAAGTTVTDRSNNTSTPDVIAGADPNNDGNGADNDVPTPASFTAEPVPVANDDSATTLHDTPVTLPAITDDTAGSPSDPLVPSSVVFTSPNATGGGKTLVVAGQGTWTVNTDGTVTFDPLPTFAGTTTPVQYQIADSSGDTSTANLTVTVRPGPTATPDTRTTKQDTTVTLNPLANDTASQNVDGTAGSFDTSSLVFTSPDATGGGKTLVVAGEGTYTINPDGTVTFDPLPSFTGQATPVAYEVTDSHGFTTGSTITITLDALPVANDDAANTAYNTPVSLPALIDDAPGSPDDPLVPGSVVFTSAAATNGGKTLVTSEGTWQVNSDGTVTFTPADGYTGTTAPVQYRISDSTGDTSTANLTVTVRPGPTADNEAVTTKQDTDVTVPVLTGDVPGPNADGSPGTFDVSSVVFTSPDATNGGKTLVVAGQGTWTVNPDGTVTFDPLPTFTGTATAVEYAVTDSHGNVATATVTVTVDSLPVANDDAANTPFDTAVVLPAITDDTAGSSSDPLVVGSVVFTSAAATNGGKTLVTTEGTWQVNADGTVTFTPADGYTGTTAPVEYQITDSTGDTDTANLTVTVRPGPSATPDSATTNQGVPVDLSPLANDTPSQNPDGTDGSFVTSTLVLTSPDATDGGKTLVVAGQGTWTVNADGTVTFDPLPTFTGTTAPVAYAVTDTFGNQTGSTMTVTVDPVPVATDDAATTLWDTPVTLPALTNDSPGAPSDPLVVGSVVFTSPDATNGGKTLVVPGQGTWTVNADGTATFDPLPTFSGTTTAVEYRISDSNGDTATATLTVTVRAGASATPDTDTTNQGTPVTVGPLANDIASQNADGTDGSFVASSLVFTSPDATDGGKTLVVPGEGTWQVNPDGTVTFTPAPSFTGTATAVEYAVTDSHGFSVTSTITITVDPVPTATDDSASTLFDTPVSLPALTNDSPGASSDPLVVGSVVFTSSEATNGGKTLVTTEGTWQVNPDGTVTFTPADGYSGTTAPVEYQISDSNGDTATATLTVTVRAGASASPDTDTTKQDVPVTVSPLAGDTPSQNADGTDGSFDTSSLVFTSPDATDGGKTLVVPGEGTWQVNPDGTVTFDPLASFTGQATPVAYEVTDSHGFTVGSTITITVDPLPVANDDAANTAYNTAVVLPALTDDAAGSPSDPLVVGSVVFTSPAATNDGKTLVTTEGTWQVNADGTVTFTPADGYSGTTAPVEYRITDSNGDTDTANLTVTVRPGPTAAPDADSTKQDAPVTVSPLVNDTPSQTPDGTRGSFVVSTLVFTSPAATDGGKTLVVPGQGTWTVNPDGTVTFDPIPSFTGTATPVAYAVTDTFGNTTGSTITIDVDALPVANDDAANTPFNTAVTLPALTDDAAGSPSDPLVVGSVVFTSPEATDGGKTLVTTEGTWQVNADGTVTFTPADGYSGTTAPVEYRITDSNGDTDTANLTVTVRPGPTADDEAVTTKQDATVTIPVLTGDVPGPNADGTPGSFDTSSVVFTSSDATDGGKTLVVPGDGTWTVNPDGTVTFDPEPTFTGEATPVDYAVTDSHGNTATATITVTVDPLPVANDDAASTPFNTPVTLPALTDDAAGSPSDPLVVSSVVFTSPEATDDGKTLVTTEGTWQVNADGTVTFTPKDGYSGTTAPVEYRITDSNGDTDTANLTVTVQPGPSATPDRDSTPQNVDVTVSPLVNDTPGRDADGSDGRFDPSSLVFTSPAATDGGKTLVVPGEGTWTVNPDGTVTFDPEPSFTGATAPVDYAVTDSHGNTTGSTITITVSGVKPVAVDDSARTPSATPVTIDVLANDSAGADHAPLDPATVRLVDPVSGELVTTVTIPGQGTWSVNQDGTVTFAPVAGFAGEATAVDYEVRDTNGTPARATITVVVETAGQANPDSATTPAGKPVTVSVLGNDVAAGGEALLPDSVCLLPGTKATATSRVSTQAAVQCLKTYTEPGVGTWTVNPDGTITFEPADGFSGQAEIPYSVTDSAGNVYTSTLTVTVAAPPAVPAKPKPPVVTEQPAPGVADLPFTGAAVVPTLALAGMLLALGLALTVWRRRLGGR